jgi:ABC-type tungstate transport system substrate-binding protein
MLEITIAAGAAGVGFIVGYAICAIVLGGRIEALEEEIATHTDRDEKGRFKKSMRTLKYD